MSHLVEESGIWPHGARNKEVKGDNIFTKLLLVVAE